MISAAGCEIGNNKLPPLGRLFGPLAGTAEPLPVMTGPVITGKDPQNYTHGAIPCIHCDHYLCICEDEDQDQPPPQNDGQPPEDRAAAADENEERGDTDSEVDSDSGRDDDSALALNPPADDDASLVRRLTRMMNSENANTAGEALRKIVDVLQERDDLPPEITRALRDLALDGIDNLQSAGQTAEAAYFAGTLGLGTITDAGPAPAPAPAPR